MLLSISILTYNRLALLKGLIGSIRESGILDDGKTELVILDNGSTDGTSIYLQGLAREKYVSVVRREFNLRGSQAYEQLIQASKGDWIISPGDDDIFIPSALRQLPLQLKLATEETMLMPFAAKTINQFGTLTPIEYKPTSETRTSALMAELFHKSIYWFPATCFRSSLVTNFRVPKTITVFDWWIWLQGCANGVVSPQSSAIIKYRVHDGQEQRSYSSRAWNLDYLDSFLHFIESGSIRQWLRKTSEMEVTEFFSLLSSAKQPIMEINLDLLYLRLARAAVEEKPSLSQPIIDFLVSKGLDPRFVSQYFGRDLSLGIIKKTLIQLGESEQNISANNDRGSLESLLSDLLLEKRKQEVAETPTPFEFRILTFYRKIRYSRIVRKVIKK
jgi:glycosyltransferase involved in cell wall biosynthesis